MHALFYSKNVFLYAWPVLHPYRFSPFKLLFECLLTDIKHPPQSPHPHWDSLSPFLSLSLSSSPRVVFHYGVSRCSKYGAPQTADLGWTADPCISNASPKVPCLQGLPLCGCGRSAASVIHPLARSPASKYWFLFPQSPGERARKD